MFYIFKFMKSQHDFNYQEPNSASVLGDVATLAALPAPSLKINRPLRKPPRQQS